MNPESTTKRLLRLCLAAVLGFLLLASCDDENEAFEASTYLWSPAIHVEKGNGEAKIFLGDPTILALYVYPGPARPSHFTIMMSNDLETFSEYETVNDIGEVTIENLVNGKPYYFFVTAHRRNFPSVQTDTLMIIPSAKFEREAYMQIPDEPFERFSVSFDETYGLYRINDKYYLFNSSNSDVVQFVDNQTYYSSWSPNANKLVYLKNIFIASAAYPSSINLYDAESLTSTTLLSIPDMSYLVSNPVFTPDGNKITYLSTEDNAKDAIYDLWSIDITTQEKIKLSDFKSAGFKTNNPFAWHNSGQEVFITGSYNIYDNDIYKFNISSKVLAPVIASKWSDQNPVVSPDGNTLAFVSTRSGEVELWTYDLINSTLRQITGEGGSNSFSAYSEIQWLDNDRVLISVVEDNRYQVLVLSL